MRLLLDRCVPKRFGASLVGHDVVHASEVPWGSEVNGRLVRAADQEGFGALITVDKNMPHQTPIAGLRLAVVVLDVRSNRLSALLPVAPALLSELRSLSPGRYHLIRT